MSRLKVILLVLVLAFVSNLFYKIFRDHEQPDIPEGYWGPKDQQGSQQDKDTKIHPFKINVDNKILQGLKAKLKEETAKKLTSPLEGQGFQYGFNTNFLPKVLNYWLDKYDWRAREKLLNQYPAYKTRIAGLDIHFQHIKVQTDKAGKKYKKTKPLLIIHGWPGSFVEHQGMIPLLSQPENSDFNFELIIPSLPGFGFSDGAVRPGLGPLEMARIFLKLMQRLGHEKFYVQGGDWGALITSHMATRYPQHVLAIHSNMCLSMHPRSILRTFISSLFPSFFMSPEEMSRLLPFSKSYSYLVRESGYFHLQATKPDTIGVALSQSPSGLAAYILEKFSTWTNGTGYERENGLLENMTFTMDQLLDNLMVYWVTNSITTSMRIYAEAFSPREMGYEVDRVPIQVPTSCIMTTDEYTSQSEWILKDKYPNIIRYTLAPVGGHFLAMEQPKLLAQDVIEYFGQFK